MTIYYRDDSVLVTSAAVQVGGRSYPLREMAMVWHRRGGRGARGWRVLLERAAFALAPLAPLVASAATVAVALRLQTALPNRVALLLAAGLLALLTVPLFDLALGAVERSYDRGTRVNEIWARWRGTEVLLLRTGDRLRFGRVYRALQRAIEHLGR